MIRKLNISSTHDLIYILLNKNTINNTHYKQIYKFLIKKNTN